MLRRESTGSSGDTATPAAVRPPVGAAPASGLLYPNVSDTSSSIEESNGLGDRHRSLEVMVVDELRARIVDGRLEPGSRLVPGMLATEFGVSRGPVRAALQQLAAEGLVVVAPRRGAMVAQVSMKEALDCYDVRAAIEGVAAQRAAENATDEQLEALESVIVEARHAIALSQWHVLAELNNRFHHLLAEASDNGEIVALMRHYAVRIAWIFSQSAEERGAMAWDEHELIVEAVRRRDPIAASRVSQAHISASRTKFIDVASSRLAR
jgi:DNA-binding GntR family transcriptional regulator